MEALTLELSAEVIDSDVRINEVLLAYSELIASLPELEIISVNEHISTFYQKCKGLQRLGFYVDLISYYCSHSKKNYEDYAKEYMENVLVLMNDKDDKLLEKVNDCLNSIYDGLSKESQF